MNRRQFLQTVGGAAAAAGALRPGDVEAASGPTTGANEPAMMRVAVLWEPGLQAVDTDPMPEAGLREALAGFESSWFGVDALAAQLTRDRFDVVVTPYGSAMPRPAWPALRAFLSAGGNWLNLGGAPCSVPVARDRAAWRPEMPQTAMHEVLGITQAFAVDIPAGVTWATPDAHPWAADLVGKVSAVRAFAFYARLSDSKYFPDEDGSDGPRHAVLEPLLMAMRADEGGLAGAGTWPVAAPVVMMDRLAGEFAGGRWIFVTGNGATDAQAIRLLVSVAAVGCHRLTVSPTMACYHGNEAPALTVSLSRPRPAALPDVNASLRVEITGQHLRSGGTWRPRLTGNGPLIERTETFEDFRPDFYRVDARMGPDLGVPFEMRASTGFWVHDAAVLERGTPLSVDAFSLRRDGKPFFVTGTTYMASDVHRQFLLEPNPAVWDRDFTEMRRAGVNVVRTGIWTGWARYMREPGEMNESALRALDVFLLAASRHDIVVVFTFFAFLPPTWGGANSYLDPRAVGAQKAFVTAMVRRYVGMKGVVWDLINEPSFCSPARLWTTRPNYDEFEARAWREWLASRYPSSTEIELDARLQELWRTRPGEGLTLPALEDFEDLNLFSARRPLKALEYRVFAQAMFRQWVDEMTAAIRAIAPPAQMITVGQDEGGTGERPSNQCFGPSVDLTSIHTWWNNDDLLWDTLVSKHPEKANLAQETGVMFYEAADGRAWRTEAQVRDVFERKLALAVGVGGAGFINWIWNTNPYMPSDNEAAIGLLRPDGSVKPEFDVWRAIARFTRAASPFFDRREREQILMIIPHANQFSVRSHAIAATRRAVRALHYHCRAPMAAVGEFNLASWPDRPRVVILPSPRILTRDAWASLRTWVEQGTTLLVTGPFDDDEHWIGTGRMAELGLPADVRPAMPEERLVIDRAAHALRYRGEKMHRIDTGATGSSGRFDGVSSIRVGSGQFLWSPLPVELADEIEPTAALYRLAMKVAGVEPAITTTAGTGVLIHPAIYGSAVLYTLLSETSTGGSVTFTHTAAGLTVSSNLRAGGASLVLVDRRSGNVLAAYPEGSASRGPVS